MKAIHAATCSLLLLSACASPTTRVAFRPEPRRDALPFVTPLPPARPQVMVTAPVDSSATQRTLGTITEEERTELLRAAGSPILPYSPGPAFDPPVRTVVVQREVWGDPYYYPGPRDPAYWAPLITTGATLAFMTAPFWGCWGWNFCWN